MIDIKNFLMSDSAWLVFCFVLVLLMQGGFLCLESGQVRQKNSVNVAMKNIADFIITIIVFWLIGYGIIFGDSVYGWFGSSDFLVSAEDDKVDVVFLLFQSAFSATAVTLTAGAVSERMKFTAYLYMILLVCVFIYPLFAHWAWGGMLNPDNMGFLQKLGFVDFAGSTVVHSLGGWVALAATIILGPRIGRFAEPSNHVVLIHGSNYSLAMLGAFFLIIGWIGFNAGSALSYSANVPAIIFNTMLSAASGGVFIMLFFIVQGRKMDVMEVLNGVLAGLVAITAACNLVNAGSAFIIGMVGAFVYLGLSRYLKRKCIDDVVDVVPVHLGAGIWGTLSVAIFADLDLLTQHSSRQHLFFIQCFGIAVCAVFSFVCSYVFLYSIDRVFRIRVGNEQERVGLDVSEHGIPDPLKALSAQIEQRVAQYGILEDERSAYSVSNETISGKYEQIITAMEKHLEDRQAELDHMRMLSNNDSLTDVANRRFYDLCISREFIRAKRYQEPLSLVLIDIDYFKQFNDTYGHHLGDKCLVTLAKVMKKTFKRSTDLVSRLGGDEFAVILPNASNDMAKELGKEYNQAIKDIKLENKNSPMPEKILTVSIGIATFDPEAKNMQDLTELFIQADGNLYSSKGQGRNNVVS